MISLPLTVQVIPRPGFAVASPVVALVGWSVRSAVVAVSLRQSSVHILVPSPVGATFASVPVAVQTSAQTSARVSQLATRGSMLDPLTDASGAAFTIGANRPLHAFR